MLSLLMSSDYSARQDSSAQQAVIQMLRGPSPPEGLEEVDNDGLTPLFWTAYHGDVEVMKLLCKWGANELAKDKYGNTVLGTAAWFGNAECVEFLLGPDRRTAKHADEENGAGITALRGAEMNRTKSSKHEECVTLLKRLSMDARPALRPTLIITHSECANHKTGKDAPERPARLKWLMDAAKHLHAEMEQMEEKSLSIREVQTSEAMLAELRRQLDQRVDGPSEGAPPLPSRSASVHYFIEHIAPAVAAVHTKDYLNKLAALTSESRGRGPQRKLDDDTPISPGSFSAGLCAVLSSCQAVDAVCTNLNANAFAVVRPPGHHAGANGPTIGANRWTASQQQDQGVAFPLDGQPPDPLRWFDCAPPCAPDGCGESCKKRNKADLCGQGFCLLNNAAIAARRALKEHGAKVDRVVIIDIDLHHGNGTEEIVRGWDRVMFVSLHGVGKHPEDPEDSAGLYPGTATTPDEVEERLVNVPLRALVGPEEYLKKFDEQVVPAVTKFLSTHRGLIIISCGFDACIGDSPAHENGFLHLTPETYGDITKRITELSATLCQGRLVSLLEGGYKGKIQGGGEGPLVQSFRAHIRQLMSAAEQARGEPAAAAAAP